MRWSSTNKIPLVYKAFTIDQQLCDHRIIVALERLRTHMQKTISCGILFEEKPTFGRCQIISNQSAGSSCHSNMEPATAGWVWTGGIFKPMNRKHGEWKPKFIQRRVQTQK